MNKEQYCGCNEEASVLCILCRKIECQTEYYKLEGKKLMLKIKQCHLQCAKLELQSLQCKKVIKEQQRLLKDSMEMVQDMKHIQMTCDSSSSLGS
jgi:hypothetical protein